MSELKAGVGLSRKWDAREAGREVAETALEKLDGEKPKFFLLFSTIHYKKYGGFQELLNGVWEVLPEGTPLIGGTVAGFMNNYGCFTRGATALAVSYQEMEAIPLISKNVRSNPLSAANDFLSPISNKKITSTKPYLFVLISGPKLINFPNIGKRKLIKSKGVEKALLAFAKLAHKKLQGGISREDEFLEQLIKLIPDFYILLGTSVDDFHFINNYQFFNKSVITDSAVGLAVLSNLDIDISSHNGMRDTGITFQITDTDFGGFIIKKINKKGAWTEYLNSIGWKAEYFKEDEQFFNKIMYYPIGIYRRNRLIPIIPGIVIGDSMTVVKKVKRNERASILTTNGQSLIDVVNESIEPYREKKPLLGIISSCITRLLTLGKNVFLIHDILRNYFDDAPFVSVYVAGEGIYSPTFGEPISQTMSFNISLFWKN